MEPPQTSLSVSKITPPRLPKILHRQRLLKLIEQNNDKKLLLILGQAAYKKVIGINNVLEDAYQRLMVLYSNMGKINEGLKVYEMCRKTLRDELDVEPDQVTVALYEKILE